MQKSCLAQFLQRLSFYKNFHNNFYNNAGSALTFHDGTLAFSAGLSRVKTASRPLSAALDKPAENAKTLTMEGKDGFGLKAVGKSVTVSRNYTSAPFAFARIPFNLPRTFKGIRKAWKNQ